MSCLIVFRSMTQAQRAASILIKRGISVRVIRPPLETGKGSCSAALQLAKQQLPLATSLISKLSFAPLAYYCVRADGTLQEVIL